MSQPKEPQTTYDWEFKGSGSIPKKECDPITLSVDEKNWRWSKASSPCGKWKCWQCFDSYLSDVRNCKAPGCILRKEVEKDNG